MERGGDSPGGLDLKDVFRQLPNLDLFVYLYLSNMVEGIAEGQNLFMYFYF